MSNFDKIKESVKVFKHRANAIKPMMIDDAAAYELEVEHRR